MLSWGLWWTAVRPRTLSLSLTPVIVGSALAWYEGAAIAWAPLLVAALCALLIQAGTNLFNDASDAERGNDGPDRVGPLRITAAGLATAAQVKQAAWALFAVALLGGLYLVLHGGWPILALGLASLLAGWAYSGGPRPLSYTAWGEVFVIIFFGLAAVGGSFYLQHASLSFVAVAVGFSLGLQAAAVLLVNNVRDLESDRRAGRRTLATLTTTESAHWLYGVMMLAPFPILAVVLGASELGPVWLALPWCLWLVCCFWQMRPNPEMNLQLARTAQSQVLLGGLLVIAFVAAMR